MADNATPNVSGAQSDPVPTIPVTPEPQAPSVLELKDDSVVRIPGVDKEVKFGEHFRGLQSQFTKASQKAAKFERDLQEARQAIKDREDRLMAFERMSRGDRTPPKDPAQDLLAAIKSRQVLSGEEAAAVMEHFLQRANSFQPALQHRDQAMLMLGQEIAKLKSQLSSVNAERADVSFNRKISGWLKELDLPDEAADLAAEIYLAYEGEDLDSEFPDLLRKRWESVEKLVRARDRARRESARSKPFVPGKGGNGAASKPINTANMSPKQITDEIWESLVANPET